MEIRNVFKMLIRLLAFLSIYRPSNTLILMLIFYFKNFEVDNTVLTI